MIVWGTLAGSYRHAWIAVFIGGVLITCLSLYNKGRADTDKADTRLEKLLENKYRTLKDDPQWKMKLLRFALGRGYSYEQINSIINEKI